jgi:hypothetical protein
MRVQIGGVRCGPCLVLIASLEVELDQSFHWAVLARRDKHREPVTPRTESRRGQEPHVDPNETNIPMARCSSRHIRANLADMTWLACPSADPGYEEPFGAARPLPYPHPIARKL